MATNKGLLITAFNKKLGEFISDLIRAFPDDRNFKSFQASLNLVRNFDERKPQYVFHKYVVDVYRDRILSKDEQFFLENNYQEVQSEDITGELIHQLKGYWANLSDENKAIVWDYLCMLVKISDKAAQMA
jgi:hypothetical protein